jgi:membrane fusion protein (multidrug efflux system)
MEDEREMTLSRRSGLAPAVARATAVAALALAAGCQKSAQQQFAMPPMPVETAVATRQRVTDRFEAVGTIEAGDAITVVSEVDAAVVSLPFREGESISRGALIAQLDDAQIRAEVDRAEALRDQRAAWYGRVESVVSQGAGARQDLDDAAATLKVAEAELALARARLAKTRIVAPFDGIVGARRVSPGAFVRSGEAITDLARVRELRITFSVPERYLATLARGAAVRVSTPAFPVHRLSGRIDVVEPVLDPNTRSARVVARVENPGELFRPGMSADVSAVLSEREAALTIPNEAVFVEGSQSLVYVVKPDSTVTRAVLSLGTRLSDVVEVTDGLGDGAVVVRAGHQKLFEGSKVMTLAAAPAPPPDSTFAAPAADPEGTQ